MASGSEVFFRKMPSTTLNSCNRHRKGLNPWMKKQTGFPSAAAFENSALSRPASGAHRLKLFQAPTVGVRLLETAELQKHGRSAIILKGSGVVAEAFPREGPGDQ